MKLLVLQHAAVEHPGIFRDFLRENGIDWDTVQLDEGQPIPAVETYDMMLVMGEPQDVIEIAEKIDIKRDAPVSRRGRRPPWRRRTWAMQWQLLG